MRQGASGNEPPPFSYEVTADSLPAKLRRGRKPNAGSGFEPGHLRAYEGTAPSLPSKLNRRRKPRAGLIFRHRTVAGPDRGRTCRLSSFDERVFRSNRSLTASENKFGRKTDEDPLEPFPHDTRVSRGRSYLQPILPEGAGNGGITPGGEVAPSSLPEKKSQEKTEQGV